MTREEILNFLNEHHVCYLATVEGDQPHVRGMLMYRADADGIILHTGVRRNMYKQILANNKVEVCFHSEFTQIRVMGEAEIIDDINLKKEIVEARPFMKHIIEEGGYDILVVFRIKNCKAAVWTRDKNSEPTVFQKL